MVVYGAITSVPNFEQRDVKATYVKRLTGNYSVDIVWGSLEYKYKEGTGAWNPSTHTYATGGEGWSNENGADIIKVINHSDVKIKPDVRLTDVSNLPQGVTVDVISGPTGLSHGSNTSGTPEITDSGNQMRDVDCIIGSYPSNLDLVTGKVTVKVAGTPASAFSGQKNIAKVTVTINSVS